MSEPVVKQRPTVDLNDFERRMRHAPSHARDDDPLAELARLVGEQHDPFGDVFAQEASAHRALQASHDSHGRRETGFDDGPMSPRLFGDFAAIEAGLRGGISPHAQPVDGSGAYQHAPGHHDQADSYGQDSLQLGWADQQGYHEPAAPRTRRPMFVMAATIAVGVVGIGAAFALKGHISTSPREIKTIVADAGPTKIQPPADNSADQTSQDSTLLDKSNQAAPTKLVSREEQPVDIAQAVQDNASRASTDASSVPVPPSPGQMQTAMTDPQTQGTAGRDLIGDQVHGFGMPDMPAPKRVKVVSVRPDGTILPNDRPPAAALPGSRAAQSKPTEHAAPVAKASTPKAASVKSTSRVTTTPKTIESLAAGDDAAPPHPSKKVKPQHLASADTGQQEATEAALPASAPGNGSFAVQLAAPGSEAEAKSTMSRLEKKFGAALGGHHLGFHKAESNGKSVFRVRVGSLSKTDAASLCEKLKAAGGTCFVAKN